MTRRILVALLISIFVPYLAFGVTATSIRTGSGSNKISIYFWPVHYTVPEQSEFETEIANHIGTVGNGWSGKFWDNTTMAAFKERFDFYKILDAGSDQTEAEIVAQIDTVGSCMFRDSFTCAKIDIVIDRDNTDSATSTKEEDLDSDSSVESWVYLRSDSDGGYLMAHEVGIHVIGYQLGTGSQAYYLKDEYAGGCSPTDSNGTIWMANVHDKNSNEKWADLEAGAVVSCSAVYVPTSTCTSSDGTEHQNFCGVCNNVIRKGFEKRTENTGVSGYDATPPVMAASAVDVNLSEYAAGVPQTAYDSPFVLTATPTDAGSGIYRVEFYIKPDGGTYTSIGVDSTAPYTVTIDPSSSTYTSDIVESYTIRVVAIDNWYNVTFQSYWVHFMPRLGRGCTSLRFIDQDCDGYGVGNLGTAYMKGPDADDRDGTINTTATVEAKVGSITSGASADDNLKTWLAQRVAQPYTRTGDVWYISNTGSDATCAANDISAPCHTYDGTSHKAGFSAGDTVVFRDGVHDHYLDFNSNTNGTAGNEILVIGMPGELPQIDTATSVGISGAEVGLVSYIIFDSLALGQVASRYSGSAFSFKGDQNITVRYTEVYATAYAYYSGAGDQDSSGHILEYNNFHGTNTDGDHTIYLACNFGSYGVRSEDHVIRGNLFYDNSASDGRQHLHINGPTRMGHGQLVENNIFHTIAGKAMDMYNGVRDSTIRNNILFNANKQCIVFFDDSATILGGEPHTSYNHVINNTFITGRYSNGYGDGSAPAAHSPVRILNDVDTDKLDHIDFVNNIFITYGGVGISYNDNPAIAHWDSATFKNNIFYCMDGTESVAEMGINSFKTLAEFESQVTADGGTVAGNVYGNPNLTDESYLNCLPGYDALGLCTRPPGNYNLKLTTSSLLSITKGLTTYGSPNLIPTTDIRGVSRGTAIDIGAFEWESGTTPPAKPTGVVITP